MKGRLEFLIVKLCQHLPLNITFFEKEGFCQNPTIYCSYCKCYKYYDQLKNKSICHKQTYQSKLTERIA
ncbi:MAG: hypothetical protein NTU63_03500 [Candidatus Pacearchaeota archaeon]|nr:hypothetical protein [Candidatus Pacearchaeota archaeon]